AAAFACASAAIWACRAASAWAACSAARRALSSGWGSGSGSGSGSGVGWGSGCGSACGSSGCSCGAAASATVPWAQSSTWTGPGLSGAVEKPTTISRISSPWAASETTRPRLSSRAPGGASSSEPVLKKRSNRFMGQASARGRGVLVDQQAQLADPAVAQLIHDLHDGFVGHLAVGGNHHRSVRGGGGADFGQQVGLVDGAARSAAFAHAHG